MESVTFRGGLCLEMLSRIVKGVVLNVYCFNSLQTLLGLISQGAKGTARASSVLLIVTDRWPQRGFGLMSFLLLSVR